MSLPIHATSAPAGELLLFLLVIWHPSWAAPLRYAEDTIDWTVTIDGEEVTFPSTGLEGSAGGSDEGGVDERDFRVPDQDLVLWDRIEDLIGDLTPIRATLYRFLSSDLSAPQDAVTLDLASPRQELDRSVSFSATTANVMDRGAPTSRFNLQNAPGLRA